MDKIEFKDKNKCEKTKEVESLLTTVSESREQVVKLFVEFKRLLRSIVDNKQERPPL